jgi:hypothetical protein
MSYAGTAEVAARLPWQATSMTDDMPEATHKHKATAALDEFMATVLRHLRMGQGHPLEELGLAKSAEELQNWRSDIPGAGEGPEQPGFGAEEATEDQERY